MCLPKSFPQPSSSFQFETTFRKKVLSTSQMSSAHQLVRSGIHWCSFILHKRLKWKLIRKWKARTQKKKTTKKGKHLLPKCTKKKSPDLCSWQRKLDVPRYWRKLCRLTCRTWASQDSWEIWISRMLSQRRFTMLIRWPLSARPRSYHSSIRS